MLPPSASGQMTGRAQIESLRFPPIVFEPPVPERRKIAGVSVLLLEDHSVPLVSVHARFAGGYGLFGRDLYAAGTALPSLLRYGGTRALSPDSVDAALEFYAIQTSFGGGGETVAATMNTLTEHLPRAMELWGAMLAEPGFDSAEIAIWRGREAEGIRRRVDNPQGLAFSEFNRLLYGDHPIGWEMEESDVAPERLGREVFEDLHARILCRENLILGITGDVTDDDVEALVSHLVQRFAPCSGALPESPTPSIRREPGVYVIERDLEQSVIVMAHPTDVHLADDPEYYSATIANTILGAGGFSSRLMGRVRTEEGYAYSASSLWTMPRRYEGILGAITGTRPENTVAAVELILETMGDLRDLPPRDDEVRLAIDRVVNGFVFNFETAGQIVSRTMFYEAQDLPADWLERYLAGVQIVTTESVHRAFADHLRPAEMMILIVGDPDRIGREELARLGAVTTLRIGG